MLKKFEIVKVAKVTDLDGVYYYTLDELFIGGYDKDGRFLSTDPEGKTRIENNADPRPHAGGIVRPPRPSEVRRQNEHEAEKEIGSLQTRLTKAKGE